MRQRVSKYLPMRTQMSKREHFSGIVMKKKSLKANFALRDFFLQLYSTLLLHQECCNECKDGVELRESCVDHGVCLYVVTL